MMELVWFIEDGNTGLPVNESAEYTTVSIRRLADGYLYDWDTNAFSATGGTSPGTEYEEVTLLPGFYTKTVDTSNWENGNYHAVSYLNTPTLAANRVVEFIVNNGISYESSSEISLNALTNSTPAASLLVQEYYNNEDADGNGLIYGIDFYISSNRPKILDNIPKRGVGMSWESYLASI